MERRPLAVHPKRASSPIIRPTGARRYFISPIPRQYKVFIRCLNALLFSNSSIAFRILRGSSIEASAALGSQCLVPVNARQRCGTLPLRCCVGREHSDTHSRGGGKLGNRIYCIQSSMMLIRHNIDYQLPAHSLYKLAKYIAP